MASSPQDTIERDKALVHADLQAVDERILTLQKEVDKAEANDRKAWAAYEKRPTLQNAEKTDLLNRKAHSLVATMQGLYARQSNLRQRLQALDSPAELERRTVVRERIQEVRMATAAKKQTARDRGVPDEYLAENGAFRIGMDARYKSDLINTVLGTPTDVALKTYQPAEARKRLEEMGWMSHLDRAEASRQAKAEKKAAAAEAKAEAKAEREQAKAEAAEAKAQAKAEAKEAGSNEVTPDPKPTPTVRRKK